MYIDNLYLILVTHWVWDNAVFSDKRQRVQVLTALLLTVFIDCWSCSLFNTRLKFADTDDNKITDNSAENNIDSDSNVDYNSYIDSDIIIDSDSDSNDSDMNDDPDINRDSDMNCDDNIDSEIDQKSNIDVNYDSDSDTDDNYEAGTDKTKSILYRHISIIVAWNPILNQVNIVFVKITLLHTKEEDNQPQV